MGNISAGQTMFLTGLIMRSSLPQQEQAELHDQISDMYQSEVNELVIFLEMNQLDLTQLSAYTNDDISKRLDYIESQEKM